MSSAVADGEHREGGCTTPSSPSAVHVPWSGVTVPGGDIGGQCVGERPCRGRSRGRSFLTVSVYVTVPPATTSSGGRRLGDRRRRMTPVMLVLGRCLVVGGRFGSVVGDSTAGRVERGNERRIGVVGERVTVIHASRRPAGRRAGTTGPASARAHAPRLDGRGNGGRPVRGRSSVTTTAVASRPGVLDVDRVRPRSRRRSRWAGRTWAIWQVGHAAAAAVISHTSTCCQRCRCRGSAEFDGCCVRHCRAGDHQPVDEHDRERAGPASRPGLRSPRAHVASRCSSVRETGRSWGTTSVQPSGVTSDTTTERGLATGRR